MFLIWCGVQKLVSFAPPLLNKSTLKMTGERLIVELASSIDFLRAKFSDEELAVFLLLLDSKKAKSQLHQVHRKLISTELCVSRWTHLIRMHYLTRFTCHRKMYKM